MNILAKNVRKSKQTFTNQQVKQVNVQQYGPCVSCQFGNHCGQCACCRGRSILVTANGTTYVIEVAN